MSLKCEHVTFDCADPKAVALFWALVAGSEIQHDGGEFIVVDGSPLGIQGLAFAAVPESKVVKNRVHLDLSADDRQKEVERLVGLGATQIAEHSSGEFSWTVLADPEGNEFCVSG